MPFTIAFVYPGMYDQALDSSICIQLYPSICYVHMLTQYSALMLSRYLSDSSWLVGIHHVFLPVFEPYMCTLSVIALASFPVQLGCLQLTMLLLPL